GRPAQTAGRDAAPAVGDTVGNHREDGADDGGAGHAVDGVRLLGGFAAALLFVPDEAEAGTALADELTAVADACLVLRRPGPDKGPLELTDHADHAQDHLGHFQIEVVELGPHHDDDLDAVRQGLLPEADQFLGGT